MILEVTLKQFWCSTFRIGIENFCCRRQRHVCVCMRRLTKTEKENNKIIYFFSLAVEMCAKSLLDTFNCMTCNVYIQWYAPYADDNTWERVWLWRLFLAYIFTLSLSPSFALSFRIFSLATRKTQWFSNCSHYMYRDENKALRVQVR